MKASCPRLAYVLKGLQQSHIPVGPRRTRLPITPQILSLLLVSWNTHPVPYAHNLLWAACCRVLAGRRVHFPWARQCGGTHSNYYRRGQGPSVSPHLCAHHPSPVQDRPYWSWGRCISWTYSQCSMPSGDHPLVPGSAPSNPLRPVIPFPGWFNPYSRAARQRGEGRPSVSWSGPC